jgi:hypothetical protein
MRSPKRDARWGKLNAHLAALDGRQPFVQRGSESVARQAYFHVSSRRDPFRHIRKIGSW